jgi:hypothetical protein
MVHEVIHSRHRNGGKDMTIKTYMVNSFDRVSHSFLLDIIYKFGFCPTFIQWVSTYLSNLWITPLVNGRSIVFYKGCRGLHQGYSLSPLLYIIMAESLNKKLELERLIHNLLGITVVRGVKSINHSQFVDDTLILGG